jgi:tetratricopeptide (TPR) repeat protein
MLGRTMTMDLTANVPVGFRQAAHHDAFFAALRALADMGERRRLPAGAVESEPAWRVTVAGLVTMRLVDRWAAGGAPAIEPTLSEIESVQRAIIACDPGPIPNILTGIVLASTRWWGRRSPVVLTSVLAYARLLDGDEERRDWALADDVYTTFLAHVRTADEFELVPNACVRLGRCRRYLGRLDDAAAAFDIALGASTAVGDSYNALLARIGAASIVNRRGDLPAAEVLLDGVIRDAERLAGERAAFFEPLARAKHERAHVAYNRDQHEYAVTLLYEAMRAYTDDRLRDNALHDLATAFIDLGRHEAGRDAFLVLRAAGCTALQRWMATVNLLRLAVIEGQEPVFERYRRELASVTALPPMIAAKYFLHVGEGCHRFGRDAAARNALARATHLAEQHQFNQILLMADELAAHVRNGAAAPAGMAASSEVTTTPAVERVVSFVRELRAVATAGVGER